MQLVLSNNRVLAYGENFISLGGVVINTETGEKYENATVAECECVPSDLGEVGYEYHAGVFVPFYVPCGKGDGNIMVVCPEKSGATKDSGLKSKNLLMQNYTPTSYLPYDSAWKKMATSGTVIVAIAENNKTCAYSIDGFKWNAKTLPKNMSPVSIVYGSNKFIITGDNKYIAVSTDGINWEEYSAFNTAQRWNHLAYGNGIFVATSSDSSVTAYSTDGINWTETSIPTYAGNIVNGGCVAYGNGIFLIARGNQDYSAYSTDGATWKIISHVATPVYDADSLVFVNGKFVAVDKDYSYVSTDDGVSWSRYSLPYKDDEYNNFSYLAYGLSSWGNYLFVSVAYDTNKGAYSLNGQDWVEITLPKNQLWHDVIYSGDKFIAIAYNSKIAAYSYDGINWTSGKLDFLLPDGTDITKVVAETLVGFYGMAYQEGVENA